MKRIERKLSKLWLVQVNLENGRAKRSFVKHFCAACGTAEDATAAVRAYCGIFIGDEARIASVLPVSAEAALLLAQRLGVRSGDIVPVPISIEAHSF